MINEKEYKGIYINLETKEVWKAKNLCPGHYKLINPKTGETLKLTTAFLRKQFKCDLKATQKNIVQGTQQKIC